MMITGPVSRTAKRQGIDRRLVSPGPGWVKAREWPESAYDATRTTLTLRPVDV
jgi:hypothetical protein